MFELVHGERVRTTTVCKFYKHELTGHQKACRKRLITLLEFSLRISLSPDGSMHNWDYKHAVARSKLF